MERFFFLGGFRVRLPLKFKGPDTELDFDPEDALDAVVDVLEDPTVSPGLTLGVPPPREGEPAVTPGFTFP
jgi:hypothetical protein